MISAFPESLDQCQKGGNYPVEKWADTGQRAEYDKISRVTDVTSDSLYRRVFMPSRFADGSRGHGGKDHGFWSERSLFIFYFKRFFWILFQRIRK